VCIQHDRAAAAAEQRSQEREQTKTLEGGVGKEENGRESKEERWVLDTFSPEPERTEQNRTEKAKPSTVIDQVAGEPAAYQTLFFFRCWLQVRLCVSLCLCECSCVFVSFLALSCQIAQVKHSPWAKEQHPKMNDQIFRFRFNSV
jgi:hypothetical protein